MTVDGGDVRVVVENFALPQEKPAGPVTVRADHLVIATRLEQKDLPFAAEVLDHPAFVRRPYSAAGVDRVLGVRPDAVVAVVGTLLTAYDSAVLLLRRGRTGRIHMISRSGQTVRTCPPGHRHEVLALPAPRPCGEYEGPGLLVQHVKDEWERACAVVEEHHPEVAPVVVTERVAESWEPHLPELLETVPTADLRAQITIAAGKVGKIDDAGSGLVLTVSTSDTTRTVETDLVISNFGREPDYRAVGSRLWASLLAHGLAAPHGSTGRG